MRNLLGSGLTHVLRPGRRRSAGSHSVGASVRGMADEAEAAPGGQGELAAVRARIDQLDAELVRLLTLRQVQVSRAASLKKDAAAVHAPARQAEVLERVRQRATAEGLDPDVAEQIWRAMIAGFVSLELREHEAARAADDGR